MSVLGLCLTPFRCWFTDLDVLRHMNNGKYFSIMDLARVDRILKKSGGSVIPAQVLALSGDTPAPPSLPDWVSAWNTRQAE